MKKLNEFDQTDIKYLFTDIDDTLTSNGRLEAKAFEALWNLHDAGILVTPVTGRPAGWCELIARQWPVAGVVGENGGLYFSYSDGIMKRSFLVSEKDRIKNRKRLEKLEKKILYEIPKCRVASDQFCRMMDLAIDFCEDVAPLSDLEVKRIVELFEEAGATAKISSIHVNGWFGSYDKLSMCQIYAQEILKIDLTQNQSSMVFVGDSPNDEPMFAFFNHSFGVSNINDFPTLKSPPTFVTKLPGGHGFAEIAARILELKGK